MKLVTGTNGDTVFAVDVPDWTGVGSDPAILAVTKRKLTLEAERGTATHLAQFYGIVDTGLIFTAHVFEGLKRGMLVGGQQGAASRKLAFTWAQGSDVVADGDAENFGYERVSAPANGVFVVYVSPNVMVEEFPTINGWIEHWAWLTADPQLPGAPIDHSNRYDRRLWSA